MSKQRKKVMLAVAGSLGLHVLVLLAWACAVQWLPRTQARPARTREPIKLTIEAATPAPTPVLQPVATPPPVQFLDTGGMADAGTPPPDAKFESTKNTAAASDLSATGDAPLPTQEGRKDPSFALETRDYVAGKTPGNAASANTPPPQTAPPLPQAVARQKPPTPPPAATPAHRLGDFALAAPTSLPREPTVEEANPYDPSVRTPASVTEPPLPTPSRYGINKGGYQPQALKNAVSGSINNRGPASVAAAATPTGRYQAAVMEAIRRRWYRYIENRADVASVGSVKIHFLVGMDGRARATQVVANTANEALADISLQAILDAAIPPMPSDAIPNTGGGQLPMDLTFEFLE